MEAAQAASEAEETAAAAGAVEAARAASEAEDAAAAAVAVEAVQAAIAAEDAAAGTKMEVMDKMERMDPNQGEEAADRGPEARLKGNLSNETAILIFFFLNFFFFNVVCVFVHLFACHKVGLSGDTLRANWEGLKCLFNIN